MSSTNPIEMLASYIAMQTPVLIVCIVAILVTILRWNDGPRVSVWALLGFGLAFALSLIIPVVQVLTQQWMIRVGGSARNIAHLFTIQAVIWAILHALSYVFLLLAVFAARSPRPLPLRVPGPAYRTYSGTGSDGASAGRVQ
jgi:hypothetical protein